MGWREGIWGRNGGGKEDSNRGEEGSKGEEGRGSREIRRRGMSCKESRGERH